MITDKILKHKRAEGYYRRHAALGNVDGAWKNFVEENKAREQSSVVQDPRPMDHGSRTGYATGLDVGDPNPGAKVHFNKAMNELYEQFGQEVVDAASIKEHGVTFDKLKGKDTRSNFRRKLKKEMAESGKSLSEFEARSVSKKVRDVRDADIKLKLIDATKEGQVFKPEKFANANNITLDELKKEAKQLQRNIYTKRMITKGMETGVAQLPYIPTNLDVTDQVLKTLAESKLVVNKSNRIENVMFDVYGRENLPGTQTKNPNYNLPKSEALQKNIKEYNILKKYIKKTYKIDTELDHPLSQQTIKKLMNGTPEELTNVNILEKDLNKGFKKTLNDRYLKAVDSNNLVQKRAVEKIAKKFKLNLGSVPDGQFFDVSKIDKGVGSFETLDIKKEMLKSLTDASDLNTEWGQYIKDNPNVFKEAGIDLKTLKKPKNVGNVAAHITAIEADLKELGGKEKLKQILTQGTKSTKERDLVRQIMKTSFGVARGTGKFALDLLNPKNLLHWKSLVGKEAVAYMAGVETLDVLDRYIRQGTPIKEALGEKWTKFLMPRTSEEYQVEGMREKNALTSPASKRYAKGIDLRNDLMRTYDKLEMLEKGEAAKMVNTSDVERIANLKKSIAKKEKKYFEYMGQKDKEGNVIGDGELDFKKDLVEYQAVNKKGVDFSDQSVFGGMNDWGTDEMSGLKIDRTYTPMYKIGTSKIPSEQELAFDATLSAAPHIRERLIAPTTSKNFKYQDQKLPASTRQDYENYATKQGILPPRGSLSQVPMPDGSTYDFFPEMTKGYNVEQKRKQASMYPDFHGSKFEDGGLAGLMKKYNDKR